MQHRNFFNIQNATVAIGNTVILGFFVFVSIFVSGSAMAQIQISSQPLQDSFCYPPTEFSTEHHGELNRYCYNVGGIRGGSMLVSYDNGNNWYLAVNKQVHVDISGVKVVVIPPFANINVSGTYFASAVQASYQLMQCAINDPNFITPNGSYDSRYLECTHKVYCEFIDIFNNPQINTLCSKDVSNTPIMTPTSPNTPPTTSTTSVTIGVQNVVTVNDFSVTSSGVCANTLTVQLTSCFTIQQNFIINDPLGSISSYEAQNIIEVGRDKNGKTYAGALFMVVNEANNMPIACKGIIINNGCNFLFSLQPTNLPVKFYLTSTISRGQLLMNSNWDSNQPAFTFTSLPAGSTILLSTGVEQPQLDIVGSETGNGQPGNIATFSSADIDVESLVQLLNSPSWTPSIKQTSLPRH